MTSADAVDACLDAVAMAERALAGDKAGIAVLLRTASDQRRDLVLLSLVGLVRYLVTCLEQSSGVAAATVIESLRAAALARAAGPADGGPSDPDGAR